MTQDGWVVERLSFRLGNVLQRSKKKETKKQIVQIPRKSGRQRDDLHAYPVEPDKSYTYFDYQVSSESLFVHWI